MWLKGVFLGVLCCVSLGVSANYPALIAAYDAPERDRKIGPKECAFGSSFWCQDLQTAKKCGAVKHCIQVVWEHEKQPLDNNSICDTCKEMVKEARDELNSNETQALIKEVLDGTCSIYFPITSLAKECMKLVDEFIPEFIQLLSSRMDPQTVCKTAWMCNSNKFKQIIEDLKFVQNRISASDACNDCKNFVTDFIEKVKSSSKTEFEQNLTKACDLLHGTLESACRMAVSNYIDEIYDYITTQMDPAQVCALTAMCINGLEPPDQQLPAVNGIFFRKTTLSGPECDFCEQLINRLKQQILTNATKEEVHQMLINICSALGSLEEKCDDIVNQYFDEIYTFLMEEMDAEQICAAIGLCSNAKVKSFLPTRKPFLAGDDEGNSVNRTPQTIVKVYDIGKKGLLVHTKLPFLKPNAQSVAKSNVGSDTYCVICEFALERLQQLLNDKSTEEEIKEAVDKVCSFLPKTVSEQCQSFIDEYGEDLLRLLSQEIDPKEVCTELRLCNSDTKPELIPIMNPPINTMARIIATSGDVNKQQLPLKRLIPFPVTIDGQETCLYCQYGMSLLHDLLNINGTKDAIIIALDDVCHDLPAKWSDPCDKIIDEYADPAITMLQQENLTELCSVLSFCQGAAAFKSYGEASAAAKAAVEASKVDGCEICQKSVEMLAKLLNNPSVDKDIANLFKEICKYFPNAKKGQCQSIFDVYGPYLVKLLGEYTDEKFVCQSVELCSQPSLQVHLLGGKKCTYGPAYWCKTKVHAKACKAEEHCAKYIWKH